MHNKINKPILEVNKHTDLFLYQNTDMKTLGERIKELRLKCGMTQKELGKRVSMSQANLSELENGNFSGSSYIPQIAKVFNVDSYWLATGVGKPHKNEVNEDAPPAYNQIIDPAIWQTLSPKTRALIEELINSRLDDKEVKTLKDLTDILKTRPDKKQPQEMINDNRNVATKKKRARLG